MIRDPFARSWFALKPMSIKPDFDVLIIGGGPAGSVAASWLARAGWNVGVFEREEFPRFKIGESLLPDGNRALKEIGVWEKVEAAGFVKKPGAEFFDENGSRWVHNVFADGLVPGRDYAYQVERSRFDRLLLEHAVECGAKVHQPCGIRRVEFTEDFVRVETSSHERCTGAYLLDAGGRPGMVGVQEKLDKDSLPYSPKVAVYSHFEGVSRFSGKRAGNIVITRLPRGWSWIIPVSDKMTSVGFVGYVADLRETKETPETWFWNAVEGSLFLKERMAGAKPGMKFHVTTDYTYQYRRFGGRRYLLAGDAACFIDPIFSSGVYFAMESSLQAAGVVAGHLRKGASGLKPRAVSGYTRSLKRRVRVMRRLIETFYSDRGFDVFMSPSERFRLFSAVNSIVAGNTRMPFGLWIRYKLFLAIVRLNERISFIRAGRKSARAEPSAERVGHSSGG